MADLLLPPRRLLQRARPHRIADRRTAHLEAAATRWVFQWSPARQAALCRRAQNLFVARLSSKRQVILALVAVRNRKVTEWKEFELPSFEGWFTRALHACKGKFLEIRFDGRLSQLYRWNGQSFTLVPLKPARR